MKFNFKLASQRGLKGGPNEQKKSIQGFNMMNAHVSKMGYRDDSPYRNASYLDIHTPNGQIDMSQTGIDLMANGRFLPAYSGIHQFDSNVVRETPLMQNGGPTQDQIDNDPELLNWNKYNTPLTLEEQKLYEAWVKKSGVNPWDQGAYDMQGYYKDQVLNGSGDIVDSNGHRPDTYKKPNHPTFSNQSKYHAVDGNYGGNWTEDAGFQPSKQQMNMYDVDYYTQLGPYRPGIFNMEPNRPEHLDLSRYESGENAPSPLYYQDGGEMMELTDEEIEAYRAQGYEVDEVMQDGSEILSKIQMKSPFDVSFERDYVQKNYLSSDPNVQKQVKEYQAKINNVDKQLEGYKNSKKLIDAPSKKPYVAQASSTAVQKPVVQRKLTDEQQAKAQESIAAQKKQQEEFEKAQWEKYDDASTFDQVVDRAKAFAVDPAGMTSRFLTGQQAYIPGMGSGLMNPDSPEYENYMRAIGRNPNEFNFTAEVQNTVNPAYWGASMGNNINKGNYGMVALEGAMTLAPFIPKGTGRNLINSIKQGSRMLADDAARAGNYLTKQTPLKNTWKYNPYRFEPDPTKFYHRSKNYKDNIMGDRLVPWTQGNPELAESLTRPIPGKLNLFKTKSGKDELYFSKGVPLDKRYNTIGGFYEGPYVWEMPSSMKSINKVNGKQKPFSDKIGAYKVNTEPLYLNDAKLYKEHWLKGYKELPNPNAPSKSFKSEINWKKWNKEIPKNKALMQEYNAIEQKAKVDGTWMKNADGSPFDGTPEEFIQQNSINYKKAFPNGAGVSYKGVGARGRMDVLESTDDNKYMSAFFGGDENIANQFTSQHHTPKSPYISHNNTKFNPNENAEVYKFLYAKDAEPIIIDANNGYWGNFELPEKAISGDLEYQLIKKALNGKGSTGAIQKYIKDNNINNITIKNLIEKGNSTLGTVNLINPRKNRFPKSSIGNNGMFDITNPNIYKSVIPAVGAGAAAASSMNDDTSVQPSMQTGGQIMELTDEAIAWYKNNGYEVEEVLEFQDGGESSFLDFLEGRSEDFDILENTFLKKQDFQNEDNPYPDMPEPTPIDKSTGKRIQKTGNPYLDDIAYKNADDFFVDSEDLSSLQGLRTKFDLIDDKAGGNCLGGALNCNRDDIADRVGAPSVRSLMYQNRDKLPTMANQSPYGVASRGKFESWDKASNNSSYDSWEMPDAMIGEGLGTELYKATDEEINSTLPGQSKYMSDRFNEEILKGRKLPIGSLIFLGQSDGVYTNDGTNRARHTVEVVRFDKDGTPMVYDSGQLRRLDNLKYKSLGGIQRVVVPKGYEGYTYDNLKQGKQKRVEALGYTNEPFVKNPDAPDYINNIKEGINEVASTVGNDFDIPASTMKQLENFVIGIGAKETNFENYGDEELSLARQAAIETESAPTNYYYKPLAKMVVNTGKAIKSIPDMMSDKENKKGYEIEIEALNALIKEGKNKDEITQDEINSKSKELLENKYYQSPGYSELSPSVGPFAIKELPQYAKDKFNLDKGQLYGPSMAVNYRFKNGAKAALIHLANNYNKFKNMEEFSDLSEEQLLKLVVASYSSDNKHKDKNYINNYIRDNKLKDGYYTKVKSLADKYNKNYEALALNKFGGEYEEQELTIEEINALRAQGYRVDEL